MNNNNAIKTNTSVNLNLIDNMSYSSKLVLSMMESYVESKLSRGWLKREDGLFEDMTGNVFTLDLAVTSESVNIKMKAVPLARGF